ncbi:polygalacturonase At1g48100 [Argentina anserina]|uniref:polygalacturonase At1g48100 n=1 Tax=Argentina anserina TaxID=57926 RepID=UPI00217657C5|nr:polygalacturonase At1g48100 [Potentilla anserina]
MKRSIISSTLLLFFLFVLVTFSITSVEARKHQTKKSKPHKHQKGGNNTHDSHLPCPSPTPVPQYGSFSVLSFGAKGDGVSDDSKALIAAWKAACKVNGATVEIPSGLKFLIKPVTLQGPCMPDLVLQIDGTLMAPPKVGLWSKSSLFQWINFKWVHNFTIQGTGVVDGQGSDWWTSSSSSSKVYYLQKKSNKHIPKSKPTALRFFSSYDVTVRDIRIINSPQCHLKFDSSSGIKVDNITISSPENSPNTDGIHLQNTQNVEIHHSTIGCGDDCISIQTGCSNVHVHHISCGPGHGISLGGLGKDRSVACVSDIIVNDISFQNTLSGVRIKTWQGGIGSVKNVSFSNIQVLNVKVPMMIDQYYCDKKSCKNQTGAVAISGVKYDQIIGTFSVQPVHLACSSDVPCIDIDLIDIQLKPSAVYQRFQHALCWNSYGKSQAPLVPSSIDYCLRRDANPVKRIAKSHDHQHLC